MLLNTELSKATSFTFGEEMIELMMNRLKYLLVLLFLTVGIRSYGQKISGTVIDKTTKEPLNGAVVSVGKVSTSTDRSGAFEIIVEGYNDSLNISYFGYKKLSVPLAKENAILHIELEPAVISLKQVDIHSSRNNDFKKDSVSNRLAYSRQFNYTGPELMDAFTGNPVKQPGELLSINLLLLVDALTKKSTPEYKFNKVLIRDEQAEYVDRKFNKGTVTRITGLQSDSRLAFLAGYRPTYQFMKKATDYDVELYIKKSLVQFRAEKIAGKNPFAQPR
jgi:hypothetical protein